MLGRWGVGGVEERVGQFVSVGAQFRELGRELLDPRPALGFGHAAGLEGGQVALDGVLGLLHVRVDVADRLFRLALDLSGSVLDVGERLCDEVAAFVGGKKVFEDGRFELVGGEPLGVALLLAVAVVAEAGVVPVPVAIPIRGVAHIVGAAVFADDEAGEQVVGGVGGALAAVLASFRKERGGFVEHSLGDQGRVGGVVVGGAPAVAMAPTPSGNGYWLLDAVGGVFTFGDARFFGSIPGLRQQGQIIGDARAIAMTVTPSGNGYWLLDAVGGVFTFGDATFHGSMPGLRTVRHDIGHAQAVDFASTSSGRGYRVLDAAGGVFTFGDARFFGSIPGLRQSIRPIAEAVGLGVARGGGYWVLDRDGGVFTFRP